jgi:branched-chain amino acid transport system ATP-binding protein
VNFRDMRANPRPGQQQPANGVAKTVGSVDAPLEAKRGAPAVELRSVRVRYRNGAVGVADVSLSVAPGEFACVFGPNGAGKTTTVRAITGFLRSEGAQVVSGEVLVFGTPVTNWQPHRVSALGVGFIAERRKVFPNLTVSENLAAVGTLPPRHRRHEVFTRVYDLFPALQSRQSEVVGHLSGGQQQMVAIARGLMNEPRLLIVDELTLGLHVSLQEPLFETLKQVAATGTAVLVVDESTGCALDFASHCYLLRGGHVAQAGPAERFRGSELVVAGYIGETEAV